MQLKSQMILQQCHNPRPDPERKKCQIMIYCAHTANPGEMAENLLNLKFQQISCHILLTCTTHLIKDRDSVVSIATCYGLDGPRIESVDPSGRAV